MTVPDQRIVSPHPAAGAISRAAERVVASYPGSPAVTADENMVAAEVAAVVSAVWATLDGDPPPELAVGRLDRVQVVRMLRTEILANWGDDAPEALVEALRALEGVQAGLMKAVESSPVGEILDPFSRNLLREVAHLLRSPLGSVAMLADMLRSGRGGEVSQAQAGQLDIIQRAALGVAGTAGDLLTLVSDQDLAERRQSGLLAESLELVADVLRPLATACGRKIKVEMDDEEQRHVPETALRHVLLTIGLRAVLSRRDGEVTLAAAATGPESMRVSVASRPGEGQREAAGALDDFLVVFRVDPESRSYSLSPDGLAVAAARRTLAGLDSDLAIETGADGIRLDFELTLPPTRR